MKKYVLVTGACINTGVAIVDKFASEGWNIVFTGRDSAKVEKAREDYLSKHPDTDIIGITLNSLIDPRTIDEGGIDDMFATLDSRGITLSCVVLNAADLGVGIQIFDSPITDFMRVINTNMTWNYAIIERASRRMIDIGGGSIVFVGSNTAYRAIPNRIAYSASKSGQLGMMRALALDLGKYNIRVNSVLPGMIRTDRWDKNPEAYAKVPSRYTPLGDVAVGADIADAVYYFAEYSRNTTGAELTVDGGNTIQLYPIIPEE